MPDLERHKQEYTDAWLEDFTKKMGKASEEEEAFWHRRRQLGLGVGLDEVGKLIYGKDHVSEPSDPA